MFEVKLLSVVDVLLKYISLAFTPLCADVP